MNVKPIIISLAIAIQTQSSFSLPQPITLSEDIIRKIFSVQSWKSYKPILAKDINTLPEDIRSKLFNNRTYRNISFVGFPLKNIHFQNCTFINVDFQGMDLSLTTFNQCNFRNVKIDRVKLNEGFIFNSKAPSVELIKKYSEFVKKGDSHTVQLLNNFIFKVVKIRISNCDLSNDNLEGIQLENATLKKVILRQFRNASFKNCKFTKIDLQNTDLTTTNFDNNKIYDFNSINMKDALLYNNIGIIQLGSIEQSALFQCYSQAIEASKDDPNVLDFAKAINKVCSILHFRSFPQSLSNLKLKGMNLRYANLAKTNLSNTDLTDADLTGANLQGANLQGAILTGVDFTRADLSPVIIYTHLGRQKIGVNLQGAKLSDSLTLEYNQPSELFQKWINAAGEKKALYQKIISANFINFKDFLPEFIDFLKNRDKTQPLDLSHVDFSNADLQGADFEGIDLSYANFYRSNLTNARFKGANLTKTNFIETNLSQADFRDTDVTEASYLDISRKWEYFEESEGCLDNLTGTRLSETLTLDINDETQLFRIWIGPEGKDKEIVQWLINRRYPVLDRVPNEDLKNFFNNYPERHLLDLSDAYLARAELQGVNLSDVNLSNVSFIETDLNETLLINSNLTNANLDDAKFDRIDFTGAILDSAYIDLCTLEHNELNLEEVSLRKFAFLNYEDCFLRLPCYNHLSELFDLLIESIEKSSALTKEKIKEMEQQYADGEGWKNKYEAVFIKDFLLRLINLRVNMFAGVPHEKLSAYFNNRDKTQTLNLYNSNFEGVNLHDIDFSNSDLRKANFNNTNLKDVNLTGAKISETYIVLTGYIMDFSDEDLYKEALNNWNSFDFETQQALKTILIAKGFNMDNSEN